MITKFVLGIKINNSQLQRLPEDGVPDNLNILEEPDEGIMVEPDKGPTMLESDIMEELSDDIHTLIEVDHQEKQQIDLIKESLNMPIQNVAPVNEWNQEALLSLSLPKLFPNCYGDPTIKERLEIVTETEAYKYLIKFACKKAKTGELYYPFAEHPRFMFLVADRLRRHRTIDQSGIYLKNNPGDATMTIEDIKNIIKNGQSMYI